MRKVKELAIAKIEQMLSRALHLDENSGSSEYEEAIATAETIVEVIKAMSIIAETRELVEFNEEEE